MGGDGRYAEAGGLLHAPADRLRDGIDLALSFHTHNGAGHTGRIPLP